MFGFLSRVNFEILGKNKASTQTHEERHHWLHQIWDKPDQAFNEAQAFAWADYLHEPESIAGRKEFSQKACDFYFSAIVLMFHIQR